MRMGREMEKGCRVRVLDSELLVAFGIYLQEAPMIMLVITLLLIWNQEC